LEDILPNYIFIGDKKSSIYTIDIDKGAIVSRHSSNEDDDLRIRRPIQTDNLLTIIRVDYTLTSINNKEGSKSWNMTVSEVMAIQKGTKSELTLKTDNMIYSSGMENRINQIIANSDNSIVSIHKYNNEKSTPVKIYDYKSNNNNLEEYLQSIGTTAIFENNHYNLYEKYIKWTAERNFESLKQKSFLNFLVYKFWELYYLNDDFFFYFSIIILLISVVFVLIYLIIKYVRKNSALKQRLKEYRKISDDNKTKQALVLRSNLLENRESEEEVETTIVERTSSQELCMYKNEEDTVVTHNPNFLFNQIVDLNAKEFEKENNALTSVKLYQDKDGSLVKEEYRMLKTTYDNNEELKNRFDRIEERIEKITNADKRKRTRSERQERNTIEQSISPSSRKARSKDKRSGFVIKAVQNKAGTNISLQPSTEDPIITNFDNNSKLEYRSRGVSNRKLTEKRNRAYSITKNETSLTKEVKNNYLSSGKKNNSESILLQVCKKDPTTPIQLSKRKYNYKEYNLVQQRDDLKHKILKINTTYIDEGRIEKNFEGFEKIGQGGFGSVFKAKHKIDDSMYAIKMIKLKVAQSQNLMEYKEIKEVRTMMKLNHKNVVRYYTCWFQLQLLGINLESLDNEASMTQSYLKSIISESKHNTATKRNKAYNRINEDYESYLKRGKSEEKSNSNIWEWNNENTKKSDSIDFQADNNKALSISFEKPNDDELNEENNMYSYDESEVIRSNKKFKEPLYDVFFFMQMEFCDGLPLNEYLDLNKLSGINPNIIFSFFKQIASGVNHIHKNNVIHRDLKYYTINTDLIIFSYSVKIVLKLVISD
jgi:hypothetical protein